MVIARRLLLIPALALLLVQPSDLASCGPYFRTAVFTRTAIPEDQRAFFSGRIGIVQPSWWRRYLAMSYRTLKGIPTTPAQVATLLPPGDPKPGDSGEERWEAARKSVLGAQPVHIEPFRNGDGFVQYPACGNDAFLTAVATLNERIRQAGADSAEVRDWLAAQDAVFSTCAGAGKPPAPPPPGSSPRIQADRAYQIAAANFYLGRYDDAKAGFLKIAADTASPWHTLAPYLVAPADIRKGDYPAAKTQLQTLLKDPKIAPKAAALLDYVDAKLDPAAQLAVLGKRLLIPNSPTLARDLNSYTFLYDKLTDAGQRLTPNDELTTWIASTDDPYKRWTQDPSLPWLVAAITHTTTNSPHAAELIDVARQLSFDSPAWPSARYHAIRLLTDSNKPDEARAILTDLEPHLKDVGPSTANSFGAQQLKLARNLDEFLAAAPRKLAGDITYGPEGDPAEHADLPMFDIDASTAFDIHLPLDQWLAATRNPTLPARLRNVLARAGFVRAIILNDPAAADFAIELHLKDVAGFNAIFWMLHHPEANPMVRGDYPRSTTSDLPDGQIDNYRDNWWCAPKAPSPYEFVPPAFLTPSQRQQAAKEFEALTKAAGAPTFLAKAVLDWARTHPDDPRLPEALALTVKTSRFGCTDETSQGPISQAFRLLHNRYPNNPWTRQTPFWYK